MKDEKVEKCDWCGCASRGSTGWFVSDSGEQRYGLTCLSMVKPMDDQHRGNIVFQSEKAFTAWKKKFPKVYATVSEVKIQYSKVGGNDIYFFK